MFIILHSRTHHISTSRNKTLKYDCFTPPWFPNSISEGTDSYNFENARIPGLREMRSEKGYKLALWTLAALFCGDTDFFNPIINYIFTNVHSILREDIESMENDGLTRRLLAPRKRRREQIQRETKDSAKPYSLPAVEQCSPPITVILP